MNWLDWFIIAIIAFSALGGWRSGLLTSVARLAGIFVGLWVAFAYYQPLAQYLSTHWKLEEKIANQFNTFNEYWAGSLASGALDALSFLALLLATAWVVGMAGGILTRIANLSFLGPLNHLGGLFFGAARGLIMVLIVLTLLLPFQRPILLPSDRLEAPGVHRQPGKAFQSSKLLPYCEPFLNVFDLLLPGIPSDDNGAGAVKNI